MGTYHAIAAAVTAQRWDDAVDLIRVTVDEAVELSDVFLAWPDEIAGWLRQRSIDADDLSSAQRRLTALLRAEHGPELDISTGWRTFVELTESAAAACADRQGGEVLARVESARQQWLRLHDYGVDLLYGLLDCAVQLLGEDVLADLWNYLMRDWHDDHARRLDVRQQPWSQAAQQLKTAIVHGFHGHLSGADRSGAMTFLEEPDRWGFRFDPCGSGGRTVRDDTTQGRPRPAEPFRFAVTKRPHDWAWNKTGIQAYCVHCCLLNVVTPIDRLGYPTRVIEPPAWPDARAGGACTWWVYKDPALVPDEVYAQVGRKPPAELDRREPGREAAHDPSPGAETEGLA